MLTAQHHLVHLIIHVALEHVQASLLFTHAFLDLTLSTTFIHDALTTAASAHGPEASILHRWIMQDEEWVMKLTLLVSSMLCFC
jgi:hypothetical protein